MIKTLKSELRLRPTYDELVGMIESQGDPNRPPIEQVIDRRATLFRNNQFGSQFDNMDFLGLKKQEEDKVKNDLRRAELNHHGVMNGVSTGVAGVQTSATSSRYNTPMTPIEVQEGMEEEDDIYPDYIKDMDGALKRLQLLSEQRKHVEDARSDLGDVHHQSLPAGVEVHSMDVPVQSNQGYPPPLPTPPQPTQEEADDTQQIMEVFDGLNIQQSVKAGIKFDLNKMNLNDWSSINPRLMKKDTLMTMFKIADKMGRLNQEQKEELNIIEEKLKSSSPDTPERTQAMNEATDLFINSFHDDSEEDPEITALEQKVAYTHGFDPDEVMKDDSINYRGLMFQLFVRDLLTDEMVNLLNKLPTDQKKKQYLVSIIEGHKELDEWNADFDSAKLSRKIKLFTRERRRVKSKRVEPSASSSGVGALAPSQAASSSTPLRDIAVAGAKAGAETLAVAGAKALAKSFLPA